jgi:hypothetical protein
VGGLRRVFIFCPLIKYATGVPNVMKMGRASKLWTWNQLRRFGRPITGWFSNVALDFAARLPCDSTKNGGRGNTLRRCRDSK